jgi:integrase
MKLTQRAIGALVCPPDRRDRLVFDDAQKGLVVRVTATGSKTFLCQYTSGGQKRRVPLGNCAAVSLAAAREAAQGIMGEVAKGLDPAAVRKTEATAAKARAVRGALTLTVLIENWRDLHLAGKRERYRDEAVRALRIAFADHLGLPAADLDRGAVVRVLDRMARQGKEAMASRTAAYGRACFSWAMKRGTLEKNPFTALPLARTGARDRVLTDDELVAVWKAALGMGGSFGAIVRMLILTGQRREEVGGMAWDELAPDLSAWIIPADRAKNGAVHVVPLSALARNLIPEFRQGDLVFPGRDGAFNGWSASKERLDAASGVKGWRLHDLRRTLATGLQRLGVRLEVTEAVLNHISGSRAGIIGVYQRHDWAAEKRAALDAWGAHVMALVEGSKAGGTVIALRAG